MSDNGVSAAPAATAGPIFSANQEQVGALERAILTAIDRAMCRHGMGRLCLVMPSGAAAVVGSKPGSSVPELTLRSYRAFWSLWRRGALGFAEAYMNGWIDIPDLRAVFDYCVVNEAAIEKFPRLNDTPRGDRRFHRQRSNTIAGSRRNIADHYDLGNNFYRLWLDPNMLYSSGIFRHPEGSLDDAQLEKLTVILSALNIEQDHSLLEIGCGWGAMAEAAARAGAKVRAITISEQQRRATRDRLADLSFEGRAEVVFEDYRKTSGTFDRLVSIEMIEAVGEENWPAYFEVVSERLKPEGVAVIQAITIREDAFERYRANPDFIQRYIFPGGMLPTLEIMQSRAEASGLTFETIERFGPSYAATLAKWRHRFLAAWPAIAALGFDERFRRMWLYYLEYCEVGFERGWIDVGIYRMFKPAEPAKAVPLKEAD